MDNFAFGKYQLRKTLIHRLDPRVKLFALVSMIVLLFLEQSSWTNTFIALAFFGLIALGSIIINKTSFFSLLRMMIPLSFLIIFLVIINIFFPIAGKSMPWFTINGFTIYLDSIFQTLKILLRLIIMLSFTLVLTESTSSIELTNAFEWYMTPLKLIKFPVAIVAMTMSLALRFIPTIFDEINRIIKAQTSRGVDFNRGGLFKRLKAIISLIIPLFLSAIDRSEDLALAMEARGYDPYQKRTKYRKMTFTILDGIVSLFVLSVIAFVILFIIFI